MPRIACQSLSLPAALFCALALSACSGSRPLDVGDGGTSSLGDPCSFDTDCTPPGAPEAICSSEGTCVPGCATAGCPSGDSCNTVTGHCAVRDGGSGGGSGGGTAGGSGGGTAGGSGGGSGGGTAGGSGGGSGGGTAGGSGGGTGASTLCQVCTTNSDCQNNGLCISDPTHTYTYCTQDCTTAACPTGYLCTTDSTGTNHQCIPSGGACPNAPGGGSGGGSAGGTGGGSGGGSGGGDPNDPNNPSTNGSGIDQCGNCEVNNDCASGAICVGSSETGQSDGFCELSCNPANTTTLAGITLSFDCLTQQCQMDIAAFDISDALNDCLISYSVCGPVSGTSANFCGPVLGCGSTTALPSP